MCTRVCGTQVCCVCVRVCVCKGVLCVCTGVVCVQVGVSTCMQQGTSNHQSIFHPHIYLSVYLSNYPFHHLLDLLLYLSYLLLLPARLELHLCLSLFGQCILCTLPCVVRLHTEVKGHLVASTQRGGVDHLSALLHASVPYSMPTDEPPTLMDASSEM